MLCHRLYKYVVSVHLLFLYTYPYLLILLSVQHFNLIISLQFAVLG